MRSAGDPRDRCEVAPCQDRGADPGERFFRRRAQQGGTAERKAMIDREHDLSITKQAEVLKISRGSVYYLPRSVSPADLEIMQQLDRLHLEYPSPVRACCEACGLLRHWRKLSSVMASRKSSTPTRLAVHRCSLYRRPGRQRHRHQHGRQRGLARQRVR
jgi:hypothetical protein